MNLTLSVSVVGVHTQVAVFGGWRPTLEVNFQDLSTVVFKMEPLTETWAQ